MRIFAIVFAVALIGLTIPLLVVAGITAYKPYMLGALALYYIALAVIAAAIYVRR